MTRFRRHSLLPIAPLKIWEAYSRISGTSGPRHSHDWSRFRKLSCHKEWKKETESRPCLLDHLFILLKMLSVSHYTHLHSGLDFSLHVVQHGRWYGGTSISNASSKIL
ncbi:hypothetical protein AVEN_56701-1 [Araneus ventricosus]|uniref:Uncharacterized protein n=1 Tax=Araneus ventricosus TaxID=182803 RepID=A0A4Y2DTZ0_ARAVE|nr:hypothetical protein AVEN_56701-1 [Araneus ventricosus]